MGKSIAIAAIAVDVSFDMVGGRSSSEHCSGKVGCFDAGVTCSFRTLKQHEKTSSSQSFGWWYLVTILYNIVYIIYPLKILSPKLACEENNMGIGR